MSLDPLLHQWDSAEKESGEQIHSYILLWHIGILEFAFEAFFGLVNA